MGMGMGLGMGMSTANFAALPQASMAAMELLLSRGTVSYADIDQRCIDGLCSLPEHLAVEAIQVGYGPSPWAIKSQVKHAGQNV